MGQTSLLEWLNRSICEECAVVPDVGGHRSYLDRLACDCLLMWVEAYCCHAAVYYWVYHSSAIELSGFLHRRLPELLLKHLFLKNGRSLDLKTA